MAAQLVTKINRYIGTAAEIAAMTLTGIPTGSTFFESDTGILKVLNAAGALVTAPSESVQLSGSNVADGTGLSGVSFEVDTGGYNVLRVVDAAPFAYDSAAQSFRVINKESDVEDVVFHDAAVVAANGTAFVVGGYKTLTVEILRTATSGTIAFMAEGPSGADIALMGVNLSTFATATSTTGTGELWQFDITGLTKVFMDITAMVAGTGSITVKGKVVA